MFTKGKLMLLYSESLIHAGAGAGVGAVDLPIQRERVTNWPIIHGSGLKGSLRDHFEKANCPNDELFVVFGPDSEKEDSKNNRGNPAEHSGSISVSDARVLLFPVRSLKGTFAYLTCPLALSRLERDMEALAMLENVQVDAAFKEAAEITVARSHVLLPTKTGENNAAKPSGGAAGKGLPPESALLIEMGQTKQVVLEEFAFTAEGDPKVDKLASWLSGLCMSSPPWLKLRERLAVVHDDVFKDFVEFSTEVLTRNKIDDSKGTVLEGALWTEECLPRETLLYSIVLACRPRKEVPTVQKDSDVMGYFVNKKLNGKDVAPRRIWVGGDVTIGRGILRTVFV